MLTIVASTIALATAAPVYGAQHGCDHVHRSQVAKHRVGLLLHNHHPYVRKDRVRHYKTCVVSRAKHRAVVKYTNALRRWRMTYAHRYPIMFNRLPAGDRAWAYSTGACESGNNPATNTGNSFFGAFQFMLGTWHSAGGTGYPNQHSWAYQAVVAVRWMHIAGAGQWPNCG